MPVLDYFLHVCASQANIVLLHLERNDFLCILPCSLNQLTIHAHHCFKGWLSFGVPEMYLIELHIILSVFRRDGG